MKIRILNGPNLNILENRDKIYGNKSLNQIIEYTEQSIDKEFIQLEWFQTNSENELVALVQDSINKFDALIINPGALSHYSISLLDALEALRIPKVEVHLTNTLKRETFRLKKLTARGVDSVLLGLGDNSYLMAISYLKKRIKGN